MAEGAVGARDDGARRAARCVRAAGRLGRRAAGRRAARPAEGRAAGSHRAAVHAGARGDAAGRGRHSGRDAAGLVRYCAEKRLPPQRPPRDRGVCRGQRCCRARRLLRRVGQRVAHGRQRTQRRQDAARVRHGERDHARRAARCHAAHPLSARAGADGHRRQRAHWGDGVRHRAAALARQPRGARHLRRGVSGRAAARRDQGCARGHGAVVHRRAHARGGAAAHLPRYAAGQGGVLPNRPCQRRAGPAAHRALPLQRQLVLCQHPPLSGRHRGARCSPIRRPSSWTAAPS